MYSNASELLADLMSNKKTSVTISVTHFSKIKLDLLTLVTFNNYIVGATYLKYKCNEPYFALLHFAAVSLGLLSKLGKGKSCFDAESLLKVQE